MRRKAIPVQLDSQHIDKLRDFLSIEHPFFKDSVPNSQFINLLTQYAENGSLSFFDRLSLANLINKLPKKWQDELDSMLCIDSPYPHTMFHMEQSKRKINKITVSTPHIQKSAVGLFRTPKSVLVTETTPKLVLPPLIDVVKKEIKSETLPPSLFQKIWQSDWLDIRTYKIVKLIR